MRTLTLLFTTFLSTCGLAQINVDAPALTYLADQLDELALGANHPFTDLGPTRHIYANDLLRWRPSLLGLNWAGRSLGRDAVGLFSPGYIGSSFKNGTDYNASFAGAPNLQALRINLDPDETGVLDLWTSYQYFSDQRMGVARRERTHRIDVAMNVNLNQVRMTPYVRLWQDEGQRPGAFSTEARRLEAGLVVSELYNYVDIDWSVKPLFLHESSSRNLLDNVVSGTRTLLGGSASGKYTRWAWLQPSARLDYAHTTEDWALGEQPFLREEEQVAFTTGVQLDYYPIRLAVDGQYRYQRMDEDRFLPSVQLHGYADRGQLNLTLFGNRGGAYRNPLLSEEHLSYTERELVTTEVQTEDFWRYGVELQSNYRAINFNVEAVQRDYRRYTVVRYTEAGQVAVDQVEEAQRATVSGEVSYRLEKGNRTSLGVSANYRYDYTDFANTDGTLLPSRHAAWARVTASQRLGIENQWKLGGSASYLRANTPVQVPVGIGLSRERLDVDVRLDFQPTKGGAYFLALRGEHLTADGTNALSPSLGVDSEAFGGLPVGNVAGVLGGRRFTLAFGAGF